MESTNKTIRQATKNEALQIADELNKLTATVEEYVQSSDFELLIGIVRKMHPALVDGFMLEAESIMELNQRICDLVEMVEACGAERES